MNEFCRCCNASLKVTYGDTWKSVSIVNLLEPTVWQDSFEVLLQNIGIVLPWVPEVFRFLGLFVREVQNGLKDYAGQA